MVWQNLFHLTIKTNQKSCKAGATADKNGFFYVLDRTSGKYIRSVPLQIKLLGLKV